MAPCEPGFALVSREHEVDQASGGDLLGDLTADDFRALCQQQHRWEETWHFAC